MTRSIENIGLRIIRQISLLAVMLIAFTCECYAILGTGTKEDPYIIEGETEGSASFDYLAPLRDAIRTKKGTYIYVKLADNIKIGSSTKWAIPLSGFIGDNWKVVSESKTVSDYFFGEFDGGGHTIEIEYSKGTAPRISDNYFGLFGKVKGTAEQPSVIKNVIVKPKSTQTWSPTAKGYGVIAGESEYTRFEDCKIIDGDIKKNSSTNVQLAGIVCKAKNCEILNCSVTATTITANNTSNTHPNIASICVESEYTLIKNCHANGVTLEGRSSAGIVSKLYNSVIKESSFNGKIGYQGVTLSNSGGICFEAEDSKILNSYTIFELLRISGANEFGSIASRVKGTCDIYNNYAAGSGTMATANNYGTLVGNEMGTANAKSNYVLKDAIKKNAGTALSNKIGNGVAADEERDEEFMKSGCLAELLNQYAEGHPENVESSALPMWYEDKMCVNDTFALLRGEVEDDYLNDKPFCHPNIFTDKNNPDILDGSAKKTTLKGSMKYITEEQKSEGWEYGFVVKVGKNEEFITTGFESVIDASDPDKINFENANYTIDGTQTVTYRAFVRKSEDHTQIATGREYVIFEAPNCSVDLPTACDSLEYEGKIYKESTTIEKECGVINITIAYTDSVDLVASGDNRIKLYCDHWEDEYHSPYKMYYEEGHYRVKSETKDDGCMKHYYIDVKDLAPKKRTIDSVYVMTLENLDKPYVYTMNNPRVGDPASFSVSVGSEWVTEPKFLEENGISSNGYDDYVKYSASYPSCAEDNLITIKTIKYLSPVRIIQQVESDVVCGTGDVTVGKYTYTITQDTVIRDTIVYDDVAAKIGNSYDKSITKLYEIVEHKFTVINTKTIEKEFVEPSPFVVQINNETHKLCVDSDPFDDVDECETAKEDRTFYVVTKTTNGSISELYYATLEDAQATCPQEILIEKHKYCPTPERTIPITACGSYTLPWNKQTVTQSCTKTQVKTDVPITDENCSGQENIIYNITIVEAPVLPPVEKHGTEGTLTFTTLNGTEKTLTIENDGETGVYQDTKLSTSSAECEEVQNINYTIHPKKIEAFNKTACNEYTYTYLDGHTETFTESTSFVDTKKVECDNEECQTHDAIVRNVAITINYDVVAPTFNAPPACDKYVYAEGTPYEKIFTESTTTPYLDVRIMENGCKSTTPVVVTISNNATSTVKRYGCNSYTIGDWTTTEDAKHTVHTTGSGGCDISTTYDVEIVKTKTLDDVVIFGCNSAEYETLAGVKQTYTSSTSFTDVVMSKRCIDCDSLVRNVRIEIGHKYEITQPSITNCGPMLFTLKGKNEILKIEESAIIYDTLVSKYGCDSVLITNITINPINVSYDTVVKCETYSSAPKIPINIGSGSSYFNVSVNDASVKVHDLIFLENSEISGCYDTTFTHVEIHGKKEEMLENIVACEEYIYTKMDGSTVLLNDNSSITDVLKSKTCDCDSLINHVNIIINHNSPSETIKTENLSACDSVTFTKHNGRKLVLKANSSFLDTLVNSVGCDSVVKYEAVVLHSSITHEYYTVCRDTTIEIHPNGITKSLYIDADTTIRDTIGVNDEGCDAGKDYHFTVTKPEIATKVQSACGSLTFNGMTYTSEDKNASNFTLTVKNKNKCLPDTFYTLNVYPNISLDTTVTGCNEVTYEGVTYNKSGLVLLENKTVHGCDSITSLVVVINKVSDTTVTYRQCSEIVFDGKVYEKDTTIVKEMTNEYGCDYKLISNLNVIPRMYGYEDAFVCRDYVTNKAKFGKIVLANDSIVYDTLVSKITHCDSILETRVNILDPVHEYVPIDSCMQITFKGKVYTDSTELVLYDPNLKTKESGCDSIVHILINVDRCFPYPILVNKYDWLLICNDNIMHQDRYKMLGGVRYRWYKNSVLVAETAENYYTENVELNGVYKVGVVTSDGKEYFSDAMSIEPDYTITLSPNPVAKGEPVTIECFFKTEGVLGTTVEVFNALAIKVYETTATSSTIVIPGQPTAGHYFVRLKTTDGSVVTTKFVVK